MLNPLKNYQPMKFTNKIREYNKKFVLFIAGHSVYYIKWVKIFNTCFAETLRRYSSLPFLERKCMEDYKLPDVDFVIPKGTIIVIPAYSLHHDPEYYPDPYTFNPERFTDNKISTRNNYTFMPFGEGPRMCIGCLLYTSRCV